MKAKDLAIFDYVESVIGEEYAKIELEQVIKEDKRTKDPDVILKVALIPAHECIWGSFVWRNTSKGHGFWSMIARGEYPYGNTYKEPKKKVTKQPAASSLVEKQLEEERIHDEFVKQHMEQGGCRCGHWQCSGC